MYELDIERHSRGVDPTLHIWGWEIPVYLFLGGLAAGVMIVSSLLAGRGEGPSRGARRLSFSAPVLVSVGMGALFLDLANKENVWRFYLAFRLTSPMSWGSWLLVLVYPVTLLFSLSLLEEADAQRLGAVARRWRLEGQLARLRQVAGRFEHGLRRAMTVLAPVLVLVGGFCLRWILVSAGQA